MTGVAGSGIVTSTVNGANTVNADLNGTAHAQLVTGTVYGVSASSSGTGANES